MLKFRLGRRVKAAVMESANLRKQVLSPSN